MDPEERTQHILMGCRFCQQGDPGLGQLFSDGHYLCHSCGHIDTYTDSHRDCHKCQKPLEEHASMEEW